MFFVVLFGKTAVRIADADIVAQDFSNELVGERTVAGNEFSNVEGDLEFFVKGQVESCRIISG